MKDEICGIDRYPESESYEKLVCYIVFLWKRPGVQPTEKNLIGAVKQGDVVEIIEKVYYKKEPWYNVRYQKGSNIQEGWTKSQFLLNAAIEDGVFDRLQRVKRGT